MSRSLTARLARTLFLLIAATIATSMLVVELFVDDIEDNILRLELKAEAEHFRQTLTPGQLENRQTAHLEAWFIPPGVNDDPLPAHLRHLEPPVAREVSVGDQTFLVYGQTLQTPPGRLLLAQDISIMENREALVQWVLLAVAAGLLAVGLVVAWAGARHLARPFRRLTRDVMNTEPGPVMPRIATDYQDREFADIAEAFNRFLAALERHLARERAFIKLASHELRTPLAVMGGALDVLEKRNHLSPADRKTLLRLRRAVVTMRDDTAALLELARSDAAGQVDTSVSPSALLHEVIDALEYGNPAWRGRIRVTADAPAWRIRTHHALARMLLHNLLQNALRHTAGEVEVTLDPDRISIRDFGTGLPADQARALTDLAADGADPLLGESGNTTFGLWIVHLASERLQWHVRVAQADGGGTRFVIDVRQA